MIQRILSALLGVLFIAVTFIFASFILAAALTAGLVLGALVWWRARKARSRVIEGEYRIVESR